LGEIPVKPRLWFILGALLFFAGCDDFNRSIKDEIDFYRSVVLVDTWAELKDHISNAPDGAVLGLTAGFDAGGSFSDIQNITRSLTITAMPGVSAEITRLLFTVGDGGALTLGNGMGGRLVINNDSVSINPYSTVTVTAGGRFTLREGAELRNNTKRAAPSQGGAVYVKDGVFAMSGGIIDGNTTVGTGSAPSYHYGGGVYLGSGAVFTMTGGTISNNDPGYATGTYGGGVYVDGGAVCTLTGGTIGGNRCSNYSGSGGGVYVSANGTFTMTGGTIGENRAGANGGGVYVSANGIFAMTDGTISGNTAGTNGYVPYVPEGYKAMRSGGGAYAGGRFTMSGGTISGNRVENNNQNDPNQIMAAGGGVGVGYNGSFVMTGGLISGNNAADGGDGVHADSSGSQSQVILGGAALVAQDNTVLLDNYFGFNPNAFVMAASRLSPPGGLTAVLEAADTAAGLALVTGYTNTGAGDSLPSYTLSPADAEKFRYKQGGTLVPLVYVNGEGLIPGP
jgi:hypothetical protein